MIGARPRDARRPDVLGLAAIFLARSTPPVALTADAAEALVLHDWPWNVRELERVIALGAARAQGGALGLEHLPPELRRRVEQRGPRTPAVEPPPPDAPLDEEHLTRLLIANGCNVAAVARILGKERRQVYRLVERYGLDLEKLRRRPL